PPLRPYLRWGSWVGGDRDGNPSVTAETTRSAMAIQADHVLRGLEAVTRRGGPAPHPSAPRPPPACRGGGPPPAPPRAPPPQGPPPQRTAPPGRAVSPEAAAGGRAAGRHP